MAKYIVTGGTGFLAEELLRRLDSKDVIIVARNEGKLIETAMKFGVRWVPADLADRAACQRVFDSVEEDIRGVFHLAAFKHVPAAEEYTSRAVQSNVLATVNLLDALTFRAVDFCVGISTDKAAQVSGVYGATKLIMERLFQEAHHYSRMILVRYGNVMYSTGSVMCKWRDLLCQGRPVVITDPNATRFYWTRKLAVDLIFEAIENAKDAQPYLPEMKATRMGDLLSAMMRKYGEAEICEIGLQAGENLHEKIADDGPMSNEVELFTAEELDAMV